MSQTPTSLPPAPITPRPSGGRRVQMIAAILVGLLVLMIVLGVSVLRPQPAPAPAATPTGAVAVLSPTAAATATVAAFATATNPGVATGTVAGFASDTPPASPSGTAALSPTGVAGAASATVPVTATESLTTATVVGAATGTVTGTLGLTPGTAVAATTGTVTGTLGLTPGTAVAATTGTVTGTLGLTPGTAVAAATGIISATATVAGSPTPAGTPVAMQVVDASGPTTICDATGSCISPAAVGRSAGAGGQAITGKGGSLRLQSTAGLIALNPGTTMTLVQSDSAGVTVNLTGGRVLARAAAGRTEPLAVTAGKSHIIGTGTTFSVAALGGGAWRVSVPPAAPRPVTVQVGPDPINAAPVGPDHSLTLAADGSVTLGPIDPTESAALAALGAIPPSTPAATGNITVLPVPTLPPFPPGVVTATMVLTPPAGGTQPPLTAVPGTPPSTPVPAATAGPFDLLGLSVTAMRGLGSYTFGATLGADPATAEFTAGSYSRDSSCWISTQGGTRTDYQLRGTTLFRRSGEGAAWQQQVGGTLPGWMIVWGVLGQVDPATVRELAPQQVDAAPARLLRGRLLPAAGYPAGTWVEAAIGGDDRLVRNLVLYSAEPGNGPPVLKIGFSSLGTAPACPPLTTP
jgi:hypothetical protein